MPKIINIGNIMNDKDYSEEHIWNLTWNLFCKIIVTGPNQFNIITKYQIPMPIFLEVHSTSYPVKEALLKDILKWAHKIIII